MRARDTTALCALVAATFAVGAKTALAEMPAAIVAPDATPIVTLHAEGAQIYECKTADDGKLAWAFREPIATLILDGKTVGRHYAGRESGNTWTAAACTAKPSPTHRARPAMTFRGSSSR